MAEPVTAAGTKLFIGGTGDIATEADWTEVEEIINFGEFGRNYTKIAYNSVGNRKTRKLKGSYDDGSLQLDMARVPSDDGQAAVRDALDDDASYNFKIELNDEPASGSAPKPTTFTFKGKVFSYTTNVQDVNQVVKARVVVEIDGDITEAAATAGS